MLDALFSNPAFFAAEWYRWGVALAVALTSVITFFIFFNSARLAQNAIFWRVMSLAAALATVPGGVLSLMPGRAQDMAELPILLAYLGLLALPAALICLVLYGFGLGVGVQQDEAVEPLEYEPLPPIRSAQAPEADIPPAGRKPISSAQAVPSTTGADPADPADSSLDAATHILQADAPPEPLGWLVVMTGAAGKAYRLGALAHIGRDAEQNDIFVADEAMSRQHARVKLEKDEFVIYDLASANGVHVNGEAVQRQVLANGDRIALGQTTFAFMRVREGSSEEDGGESTITVEIEPEAGS